MRDRIDEFGDAVVVIITFDVSGAVAKHYRDRLAPLVVLVDEARATYRSYGLRRGSVWRAWGPKTWRAYARLIARGRRPTLPRSDTLQLGGDFVVDREGGIVFAYRSADPDDRPGVDVLVAAVSS